MDPGSFILTPSDSSRSGGFEGNLDKDFLQKVKMGEGSEVNGSLFAQVKRVL